MTSISIIHPSRSRPQLALETAKLWLSSTGMHGAGIEYILVTDEDDKSDYSGFMAIDTLADLKHYVYPNKTAIQAINNGAKRSSGNILIVVSDDFLCPADWDTKLKNVLQGEQDYIVKTNDGYQKFIITLPIMDRKYYERFGYIYYPEYKHMYSDSEMSCVGWMLGRYINHDFLFKHNHYSLGGQPKDEVNEKANTTYAQGEALFRARYHSRFGLKRSEIVQQLPDWSGFKNFR